jgi:predicted RND superfamily exporter protein
MARFIVHHRAIVASLLTLSTAFFFYPIVNTITSAFGLPLPGKVVRIDTNARDQWPQHPFINAQDKFAARFGSATGVAIGLVVKEGTIFTPETLQKIDRITKSIDGEASEKLPAYDSQIDARDEYRSQIEEEAEAAGEQLTTLQIIRRLDQKYPPYPVNHDQVRSVTHRSTRVFEIQPDGTIENRLLVEKVPETQAEADALREVVRQNPPVIFGRFVSYDETAALILADFVTDRLSGREVYQAVFDHVLEIESAEEDANHEIYLSGTPVLVGWVLRYAFQIGLYVAATGVATFALLLAYFRRLHGVALPFLCAVVTTIWGLGYCGWRGIAFDPLILVIPMLITARATSHTVQMAERFFEDYELHLPRYGDPNIAKREAAAIALGELIVPGTLGVLTDAAGLAVILATTIPQMRNLGEFGVFWVASILITVEVLQPVLICYLPAPRQSEHFLPAFMVRLMVRIGRAVTHPTGKYAIIGVTLVILIGSTYLALFHSKIGESTPGTPLLWPDDDFNVATGVIAEKFGGVDVFQIYTDGDKKDASGDAEPIRRMEELERFMAANTPLGAAVSVVPFLKAYWGQSHFGDPKWGFVPDDSATVRSGLFQMRQQGAPGFLRPFMTDDGRYATLSFIYRDHKGDTLSRVVQAAEHYVKQNPIGEVIVRLDMDRGEQGAPFFDEQAWLDRLYYMLGPMLPTRSHTLTVQLRQRDGSYRPLEVKRADGSSELPAWLDEFREGAIADYEEERDAVAEGDFFAWPDSLADWSADDVSWWWESEEHGIRAVAVNTKDLIVHDLKAVDGAPEYQQTSSWTRGMQFVLAGGYMGILAAVNDEVERGHVANIALIFFVIYALQSLTYRSPLNGAIVVIQVATATMFSLAYMAVRNVGLNINTLPVQSVGVGIGVNYAIYIADRIRQECAVTADVDEAVRRAIRTTGMAVSFTATTIVAGIGLWSFSGLRFQAEMAQLLSILMVFNMVGAITIVPALYSALRPRNTMALLTDEQVEALERQKENERNKGLID